MVSVVMTSVALFLTAITLTIADSYSEAKTENRFRCQKTSCSFSWDCPAWHYCDTHERFCVPCTSCTDGPDFHLRRGNCMDPMPCIESLYARQDYACPTLRIAEGNNCSGECYPCSGKFDRYMSLGKTCRANCSNGDFEVFSCIFLNEVAQWNVTRKPFWIDYETVTKPQPPYKPPPSTLPPPTLPPETLPPDTLPPENLPLPILSPPSPPLASSTSTTSYHMEALAGIVAGTVLGVSVIVFFAILLIVCSRRKKRRQDQTGDSGDDATKPLHSTPDSTPDSTPVSTPDFPGTKVPEEGDDQTTFVGYSSNREPVEWGSSTTIPLTSPQRTPLQPIEISDYNSNYTDGYQQQYQQYQQQYQPQQYQEYQQTTSNDRVTTWLKLSEQQPAVHSTSSPSVVSLHSDRPGQARRPQEHSPPHPPPMLLGLRPLGSTDSGHPRGRCSSSNSLQHETLRKSLTDLREGELRRGPTEQSQETSSGFHPTDSLQDLNVTSFPV